jgi:hypothetical protein
VGNISPVKLNILGLFKSTWLPLWTEPQVSAGHPPPKMLSLHWGQGLWLDYTEHSWLKSSSLAALVQYVHWPFSDYWAKILGGGTALYVCNIQVYCPQEWTRFQVFENNKSKLHWVEESGPDQSQNAFYHPVQDQMSSSLLARNADMKIYNTVTLHR